MCHGADRVCYTHVTPQIREVSQIKALGLLPGTSTQSGELNGLNNDTYEVRRGAG